MLVVSFVIHRSSLHGFGLVSVWYSEYEGVSVGVWLYAERIGFFLATETDCEDVCDYVCVCRHL